MFTVMLTSPCDDALHLHRALEGGCDTEAIVNILARRDARQRANIEREYEIKYPELKGLNAHLSSRLSGHLKEAVLHKMHDQAGRDATIVMQALNGKVVNLKVATQVICSRTPSHIRNIEKLYKQIFGVFITFDIGLQASGSHKDLLLQYVSIHRSEGLEVDAVMVNHDVEDLYKAGKKTLGPDKKTFIRIFSERSMAHLAAVNSAYYTKHKNTLKKAIESKMSGNFEYALLTILQCSENPEYLRTSEGSNSVSSASTIWDVAHYVTKAAEKAVISIAQISTEMASKKNPTTKKGASRTKPPLKAW